MGVRHWLAAAVIVPVAAGFVRESTPDAATPAATGQESTTLEDQVELSVTVYNSSLALVRDVRNLQLAAGSFDLKFMDIAATVNPATVHFRSLTEPSRVSVLEQNDRVRVHDDERGDRVVVSWHDDDVVPLGPGVLPGISG